MKKRKVSHVIKEARRAKAWSYHIEGYDHAEIAKRLAEEDLGSFSVTTIRKMILEQADLVFEALKDKTDIIKTQQHERLEHIYREAMTGYRLTSWETYDKEVGIGGKKRIIQKKRRIPGDARFLAAAMTAIDRILKLWGADAVQKIDLKVVNATIDLNNYLEMKKQMEEQTSKEIEEWRKQQMGSQKQLTVIPDAEVIMNEKCIYCGWELTQKQLLIIPSVKDDFGWEEIAKWHASDCEWVQTRANMLN